MGRLDGLVVLVTGGSQGFGAGIVERFTEEGAKVVNMDLSIQKASGTSNGHSNGRLKGYINGSSNGSNDNISNGATTNGSHTNVVHVRGDVTLEADWKNAAECALERFGSYPTVIVNNAGWTYSQKSTADVSDEEFDRVFDINVKGVFLSFRVFVPIMQKLGGGAFVQISSTAALRPRPRLTWYNATKAAVSTASKSMALEHAADNIRFNCVCPVAGLTPLLSKFAGSAQSADAIAPEQMKTLQSSIPLGRLSSPSDIANAALFFADPASSFITGTDLEVDGGRCV